MALDATNVRVGVTGAVYVADTDTTLPTDATTALDGGFADVGYISDGGVTESHGTEANDIRAWQNGDLVRRVQTSHDLTLSFTMVETNDVTLREFYGNLEDGTVRITGEQLPPRAWVLSVIDGDHAFRIVVPNGQITERGDITYANGDAIMREVTITAYPTTDEAGIVKAYIYMAGGDEESV